MKKSAFIAVLGKPNAGKSSLINALIGEKVLIVSPKPQTTRNRVMGILTEGENQMVFVDTPGVHTPQSLLGEYMDKCIKSASSGADAIVIVIDATKPFDERDFKFIKRNLAIAPVYIAVNKTDLEGYQTIYPILQKLSPLMEEGIKEVVPISCKTKENIPLLKEFLFNHLKEDAHHFDVDDLSDKPVSFMVCEIIREKALWLLQDEVPHGIAVTLQSYKEGEITNIEADITCEKDSHKQIIIGENGQMIKEIGTKARLDIEKLIGKKVFLKLFVRVRENWRNRPNVIKDMGYDDK